MLVACKHCGAPIDIPAKKREARCGYCGHSAEREALRTIARETPKDYKPAKEWKPPPEAPIGSDTPLRYSRDRKLGLAIGTIALIVAVVPFTPLIAKWNIWNTKPAVLLHASPVGPQGDVAKRLGGKMVGPTELDVPLRSDRYRQVTLRYGAAGDTVPASISLELASGASPDAALQPNLAKRLSGDFNPDWRWDEIRIAADHGASARFPQRSPDLDARRANALWTLLMGAAFDPTVAPSDDELRAVLGGGYPFSLLSKIPATTLVNEARATTLATFPGALIDTKQPYANAPSQMKATIALDHPLFRSVTLEWVVAQGGMLHRADFKVRSTFDAGREALGNCLTPLLGKPALETADPVANTHYFLFYPARGEAIPPLPPNGQTVTVGNGGVTIVASSGRTELSLRETAVLSNYDTRGKKAAITDETWQRVVRALDRCK